MPEILHELTIAVAPDAVYRALTTAEGLARWWTTDVVADGTVGGFAEFGFSGRATVLRMEILELTVPSKVRWRCVGGHSEWQGTEITFRVEPEKAGSELLFMHQRWMWRDGSFARCSFDWGRYLASLKQYLETGTGAPQRSA